MTRWIGKRGLWGVVTGTAVAAGSVVFATEPGDVVVFQEGGKDRKVTVVKVNKRADKSVEVIGKDSAGAEVKWVEGESSLPPTPPAGAKASAPAAPAAPAGAKDAGLPKAKARTDDPMGGAAPMPETPAERERRLFNGKLLGRESSAPAAASANPAMPPVAEAGEPKAKVGLLGRIFGKKSPPPVPAAMPGPAVTTATPPAPVTKSGPTAGGEPRVAAPVRPATPAPVVTPAPVAAPGIPVPTPLPAARPAVAPPVAAPPVAAPVIPIPTPLPAVPLPTIPGVPPGTSSIRTPDAVHVVLPVGYVPAEVAMADELRPYAATLAGGTAPGERLLAATALANCRHGSTDRVKRLLFEAAQNDPAAAVRAACVEHLVRLGYYQADFVSHLHRLAEGAPGAERDAARAGVARMTPRNW